MIDQGTNGLSRGIWVSPLHTLHNQHLLTASLFAPLPPCPVLVDQVLFTHLSPQPWHLQEWSSPWDGRLCFDRLTVWFPPPKLACQVITFILETWVERPLTTSALFFIPWTVPAFWLGLSRYLIELAKFPLLTPTFQHVSGHQDKDTPFAELSLLLQLNVKADTLAGDYCHDHGSYCPVIPLSPT